MHQGGIVIASTPMSVDEQLDLAEKNLEFLLDWVGRHDYKSSIIFGIGTGMLGVIATFAPDQAFWYCEMIISAGISIFFLLLTLLLVYLGNYPRLEGRSDSLFYFGSICQKSRKQYQKRFSKRTKEEFLADILEQCHRNSEILNKKFKYLKYAFISLLISVIPWLITIYLFRSITAIG
jgi:hypothetical protein